MATLQVLVLRVTWVSVPGEAVILAALLGLALLSWWRGWSRVFTLLYLAAVILGALSWAMRG